MQTDFGISVNGLPIISNNNPESNSDLITEKIDTTDATSALPDYLNNTDTIENNRSETEPKTVINNLVTSVSPFLLGSISSINVICVLVSIPMNINMLRRFQRISSRDQPMFIFFTAVHCVCIADLCICILETGVVWATVPHWSCQILGTLNLTAFFYQSLVVGSICIYRYGIVVIGCVYKLAGDRDMISVALW